MFYPRRGTLRLFGTLSGISGYRFQGVITAHRVTHHIQKVERDNG